MNQHATKHFFISYNKTDRTWAEWIAWHLEEAGYTAIIQAWDFRPGMSFVQKMHAAVQEAERTIAVLSTNYVEALYTYPEWEAAFKQDPRGEKGILVPVRIQECKPPGLLGLIAYIDLVGLDETAAHETLLDGVRQGRNKPPTAPLFPGSITETQRTMPQQPRFPGAFPPIWNVPYARNPYFTGRETVLHDLHEALSSDSATVLTQGHAIFGLGGIGKTQTAVEYTYRYRSEYRYIFWTRADTEVALQAGFVDIAKLLDLSEKDATNPADTVQAVKHWLEHAGEWLLIFDNADTPEMLKAYYPRTPRGHILLTSRAQLFDTLGIARPLALEKMRPEEALSFLYTRTGRAENDPAEKNAAEHLADELGYLPLALEQAAAYIMAKTARFQDYLASYLKQRLALLDKAQPKTGEYPASVASTWALNFQEVEQDPVAADILRVSAFLSPDDIPLELLTDGASQLGPVLSDALATSEDPLALNEAIAPLTRYSLIRLDVDAQTYSLHRMVQEVVKDQLGGERQAGWAERVVRAVEQSFPEVNYQTWTHCERYIPHVLLCAEQMDRWSMTFWEARNLLSEAGYYFYQRGQYWEAEPLLKSTLAICEQVLGPEHPNTLNTVNNLANLYWEQGKYEQAEPLYQRALLANERLLGAEHPDTLRSLNNLALLYRNQGKYEQAESLFQRALDARERLLGAEHLNTLNTVNYLAALYSDRGKYEQAEPLYQRALATRERVLGPEHPDTLNTINNLANLYQNQGKYEQAEPLYQRALSASEQVLGPEHPDTLSTVNNLASLYQNQGKYELAEPLYQRALETYEQVLGPEHPNTLGSLNNLASLYQNQGKYELAEPLYQRALETYERVLGPEHPNTLGSLNNLAELYRNQGKYEQAEPLYQRALAIFEQVLGTNHPDTAQALNNLAALYADQGKYEQAELLYQRALAGRQRVLGPEHPDTAQTLYNLAILYSGQGKYEQAEPLYQRALAIDEQVYGQDHPEVATDLNSLAILYRNQGKYEQAEPLYQRALAIREQVFGSDHPLTAEVRNNYAELLEKRKQ